MLTSEAAKLVIKSAYPTLESALVDQMVDAEASAPPLTPSDEDTLQPVEDER